MVRHQTGVFAAISQHLVGGKHLAAPCPQSPASGSLVHPVQQDVEAALGQEIPHGSVMIHEFEALQQEGERPRSSLARKPERRSPGELGVGAVGRTASR